LLGRYKLLQRYEALRALHFQVAQEELKQARRRIVKEEILLFQHKNLANALHAVKLGNGFIG
ncbi:hypothetical protein JDS96_31515, partial [Bacillus cereus group sp. N21]|nr:hypothetical protein [Bacillus cereus group sp. N21]